MLKLELSRRLPLCYASLLGTHNSGISLADGYGNLDLAYQHYFRWISWVVRFPMHDIRHKPACGGACTCINITQDMITRDDTIIKFTFAMHLNL